jgi:hypothetical protein
MSDCERLSDRMPEVAMQRAAWTPHEAAHLAGCAECRAEWALVLAARRLETRAPAVDVDAAVATVQRRLRAERAARRRRSWTWVGGAAAAAAAALAIAVTTGEAPQPGPGPVAVAEAGPLMPLPELEGLGTAQLDTLLRTLDGPLAGTSTVEPSAPDDGSEDELEDILAGWEG